MSSIFAYEKIKSFDAQVQNMKSNKPVSSYIGYLSRAIDLYAIPTQLLFKRHYLYSTGFGQFTSILVYFITIFYFASLLGDLLNGKNPIVIWKEVANMNPDVVFNYMKKLFLNSDNFQPVIGIADQNGIPILNSKNKTYYVAILNYCHQQTYVTPDGFPTVNNTCVVIQMISCLEAEARVNLEFSGVILLLIPKNISQGKLAYGLCPNKTDWDLKKNESYIQGLGTSDTMSFSTLAIHHCSNHHEQLLGIICASDQEVQILQKGFVQVIFTDYVMDPTQLTQPFTPVGKVLLSQFTNTSQTAMLQTLRHNHLISQENPFYFFPTQTQFDKFSLESSQEKILSDNKIYVKVLFYLDDKENFTFRSFGNVITILGNIGGIYNLLVIFFRLLTKSLITKIYQSQIINSIFAIESDHLSPNYTMISPREKQIKNMLKQKNPPQPNSCKLFIKLICDSSFKDMIAEGSDKIEKQLDAIFIMRKLLEVEKLKQFLLDEDQLKLYDYVPKPKIKLKRNKAENNKISPIEFQNQITTTVSEELLFEKRVQEAVESFHKLRFSDKQNDCKLIEMLGQDVKDLFLNVTSMNYSQIEQTNQKEEITTGRKNQSFRTNLKDFSSIENPLQ